MEPNDREGVKQKQHDGCAISFLAEGSFNKIYAVQTARSKFLMRVTLPVDPKHKTRGEVATLAWDNAIGFEWILTQFMPGVSANRRWRQLTTATKTFDDANFRSIGTLCTPELGGDNLGSQGENQEAAPGRVVSIAFFEGERLAALRDGHAKHPPERTVLYHNDLSLNNILIDDDGGKITAIIDWECVSAEPLWVATAVPSFLDVQGEEREDEPDRDQYPDADDPAAGGMEDEAGGRGRAGRRGMKRLWSQWEVEAASSTLTLDFQAAVNICSRWLFLKHIHRWIKCIGDGKFGRYDNISNFRDQLN
ncbi:phosphotransferase enzyme family-domain-containing protein [Lasiosphaeria ovina]|uniref:Phosphotransferase enzyme family-domain-containing protein n=1 Tax=Lasiosphaeria ovina TaxID=92902 RepID=A0AAE0JU90_9PEZI|nr:phosphotransferase enzyme family-domain-containing protein [Lasiosphaeria ovina]